MAAGAGKVARAGAGDALPRGIPQPRDYRLADGEE